MQPGREPEKKGVSLEDVAEEVLNGLFCHYEPPTSEAARLKAAQEALQNPYSFGRKRSKSILRPSSKKTTTTSTTNRRFKKNPRSVTWHDEQRYADGIEGHVASCAADPWGFIKGRRPVIEPHTSIVYKTTDAASSRPMSMNNNINNNSNSNSSNKEDTTTTSQKDYVERFREKKSPKAAAVSSSLRKVLYDDEGNPIHEDGSFAQDENVPPMASASPRARGGGGGGERPFTPMGISENASPPIQTSDKKCERERDVNWIGKESEK